MFRKLAPLDGIFLAAAAGFFALRIFLGRILGVYFAADQHYDDALMIVYADFHGHFAATNAPFNELLLKDLGYPIFLNLVKFTGLQYTDALACLWLLAAVSSVVLFARATGVSNRIIWLAIFVFVLFSPIAFDSWGGTRLYRNALLTPLYFIVLNAAAILFVLHMKNLPLEPKKFLAFQILLGLIFTLTFYVKEDGAWLLAVLAAVTIICFVKILLAAKLAVEDKLRHLTILILPLIIFFAGTSVYKAVNYKFFGVYEINIRGGGETGKFIQSVYKIQSDNRTGKIWAPADAVAKAFDASETLRANPKLREAVFHTPWFGLDIYANPIKGDFLGWVLLTAVKDSGLCHSAAEQEEFFKKVNAEIDAAFENGTLQRDSKFQLVSSMGGRSALEILKLAKIVLKEYAMHVALYKYEPGAWDMRSMPQSPEVAEIVAAASRLTNIDLTKPNEHAGAVNFFVRILFVIFALVQTVLFFAAITGTYKTAAQFFHKKTFSLPALIAAGCFLLAIVYALAIAWFSEFISPSELRNSAVKFYSVGLVPMLASFEIFGAYLFHVSLKFKR